jgi:hypothetical protein
MKKYALCLPIANTIKAMEQRGPISPGKSRDPLTIAVVGLAMGLHNLIR